MSVLALVGTLPRPGHSGEVTGPMFRPLWPCSGQEAPGQSRSPPRFGRFYLELTEPLVVVGAERGGFS